VAFCDTVYDGRMERVPPEMKAVARRLRRDATPAERRLWGVLGPHRPRFTRQLTVSHFVLDLACRSLKIGIELDGGHHAEQVEEDAARTAYLEANGWIVLRFWNGEVMTDLDGVYRVITDTVAREATHPRPLPSRKGRHRSRKT
jgi:very-short-patch-repair endonuclease